MSLFRALASKVVAPKVAFKPVFVKPILTKPVLVKPAPVHPPLSQSKINALHKFADTLEAKAIRLEKQADAIRDHAESRADAIRDHYQHKADALSAKGLKGLARHFEQLGNKKAAAVLQCAEKKASALEKLADKFQDRADCIREKLGKGEDPNEDPEEPVDEEPEEPVEPEGTPLPEGSNIAKFYLNIEGFGDAETNLFLRVEIPEDREDATVENALDAVLHEIEARGLQLNAVNQVDIFNVDGLKIAEFKVVDGDFVPNEDFFPFQLDASNDPNLQLKDLEDEDEDEDPSFP